MALVGTAVSLGGVWALFTQRNAHIRPFATPVFPRLWHSHIKLTSGRPPMHLLFLDVRGHNLFISDHIFFFFSFSSRHFPQSYTVFDFSRQNVVFCFTTTLIRREYSAETEIYCARLFRQKVLVSLYRYWFDEKMSL